MSSLGEHLRDTTSASDLKPKEDVAESVAQYLKLALELRTRPETTVTTRIDGNRLEVVVADPTAPEEIRVVGEFAPKGKKHQFTLQVGERPVGAVNVKWHHYEMGDGFKADAYLKKGSLFATPLSDQEIRTLLADALGAPEAAPHQVERVERPHLSSLGSAAPTVSDDDERGLARSPGPRPDSSLHV